MKIQLSDHFTYKKLLKFTIPSIAMMIFTSIYGVVDGFFVSNFIGKVPFTAINLIFPFLMIVATVGFMLGTGGSAIVAKELGEGKIDKANRHFSLFIYTAFILGCVFAVFGFIFIRPISAMLGAKGEILENCVIYARIQLITLPFFIMQLMSHSFFVTAEKPQLGLIVTVVSGVTNMILDALLVAVIPLGIVGASLATGLSQVVGGLIPIIYFARRNTSILKLGKCSFEVRALLKASANGSSEFMSNISMSVVSILYNIQLIKYAGENGVAAYGVMMYVSFIFAAAFIGYSVGTAPIISYHFGAQNHGELKNLLKKSTMLILTSSVVMTIIGIFAAKPLSMLFVGYDKTLAELTIRGFKIFALSFLFMGTAIYSSGFFTALNDGLTSALISFLRTLVFQIAAVMILPIFFDTDGIWISIIVAELMAFILSAVFIIGKRKKYKYL